MMSLKMYARLAVLWNYFGKKKPVIDGRQKITDRKENIVGALHGNNNKTRNVMFSELN